MTEPLPPYFDELSERSIYIPEALEEPAHTQQFLIRHRNNRITEFFIPTHELLARIDAADPDAMRAYLRETAPEVIADLYRPAPAAADHFDYLDTEIPEADSPEDVDERPDVDQARAAGEQLGKMMRAFGDAYAEAMKR